MRRVACDSPLLAALRRLTVVGQLVPAPPPMRWDTLTIYRVQLRSIAGEQCGAAICYEALLVDAEP
jgi:hypothetical protein